MFILRAFSIFTCALFKSVLFIPVASVIAETDGDDIASNHVMGNHRFWFGYAWVTAEEGDGGWFHVWAHAGSGGNDYTGGSYDGPLDEYAFSMEIKDKSDLNPPVPHWASHDI